MTVRTIKERLYPSLEQEEAMLSVLEECRWLYNFFLGIVKCCIKMPDSELLQEMIPALCRYRQRLESVHSKTRQYVLYQLYANIRGLAAKKRRGERGGPLRFKGRGWYKTFVYNQTGFKIIRGPKQTRQMGHLGLSGIGDIPIRLHRSIEGDIKQVVIKRTAAAKWFAFIQVERDRPINIAPIDVNKHVGLDMGIMSFVYDSNGGCVDHPHNFDRLRGKLADEQRKLMKKQKHSKNRLKQRVRVAAVHEKISNARNDFLHKLSRHYVDGYDVIGMEGLRIQSLMRGIPNARNMADASWGRFFNMLEYKAENACSLVVEVPSPYSSVECSRCHRLVPKTLAMRTHCCSYCGLTINRDHNSAIVIDQRAMRKVGLEESESTPVEMEPLLVSDNEQAWSRKQELLQTATGEAHGFHSRSKILENVPTT